MAPQTARALKLLKLWTVSYTHLDVYKRQIHIYGALRGRALAGAQGNVEARIFCREFHAELVSVAGQYKVLEDIPAELRGKPVQVWLEPVSYTHLTQAATINSTLPIPVPLK